jgi:uncharacterized protein YuzE
LSVASVSFLPLAAASCASFAWKRWQKFVYRPRSSTGMQKAEMTPTLKYGPADNAAYIRFSSTKVLESAEVVPAVVFDYDKDGHIVGIELLDAKAQLSADTLNAAA